MTVTMESAATPVVALDELKTYLKISLTDDDALLAGLIAAASDMAERFTGQVLVSRAIEEVMPVRREWQRLSARPVQAVTGVAALPQSGTATALAADRYAVDIDRNGDGWIRVLDGVGRVRVSYQAGIAAAGAGVPEAIRHGIVRLAGDYYARRGGEGRGASGDPDSAPPAAVSALWRPWRRMRLS